MSLNCSSNNTEGGGFSAVCQNTAALVGNWSVTGDGCRRECFVMMLIMGSFTAGLTSNSCDILQSWDDVAADIVKTARPLLMQHKFLLHDLHDASMQLSLMLLLLLLLLLLLQSGGA
jgi:hypothetical protein